MSSYHTSLSHRAPSSLTADRLSYLPGSFLAPVNNQVKVWLQIEGKHEDQAEELMVSPECTISNLKQEIAVSKLFYQIDRRCDIQDVVLLGKVVKTKVALKHLPELASNVLFLRLTSDSVLVPRAPIERFLSSQAAASSVAAELDRAKPCSNNPSPSRRRPPSASPPRRRLPSLSPPRRHPPSQSPSRRPHSSSPSRRSPSPLRRPFSYSPRRSPSLSPPRRSNFSSKGRRSPSPEMESRHSPLVSPSPSVRHVGTHSKSPDRRKPQIAEFRVTLNGSENSRISSPQQKRSHKTSSSGERKVSGILDSLEGKKKIVLAESPAASRKRVVAEESTMSKKPVTVVPRKFLAQPEDKAPESCHLFTVGRCRWGNECWYSHSNAGTESRKLVVKKRMTDR